jgi:hypothetical protein
LTKQEITQHSEKNTKRENWQHTNFEVLSSKQVPAHVVVKQHNMTNKQTNKD